MRSFQNIANLVALGSQKLDSQAKLLGHVDRTIGLDNLQRIQRWANTAGALDLFKEQAWLQIKTSNYKRKCSVSEIRQELQASRWSVPDRTASIGVSLQTVRINADETLAELNLMNESNGEAWWDISIYYVVLSLNFSNSLCLYVFCQLNNLITRIDKARL